MENTCPKFGLDKSENAWFCVKPTSSPICSRGWFFDIKTCHYFFRLMKNTCAKFGQDLSVIARFCVKPSPSPNFPRGWFSIWKHTNIYFWGWKIHVPNFVQIHRKIHDIGSNPSPICLKVGFSIWNHASIYFWDGKYMSQIWSRSEGKYTILCQIYPFLHLP